MIEAFFLFLFGASLGSFLCVWGQRGSFKKATKGRSSCSNCTLTIKGHHLIPVLSFLRLRGRCGYCKIGIPFTFILFEAGVGLVFVALWNAHFGLDLGMLEATRMQWWLFARDLFFVFVLALLFVFDLFHQLLPDRLTLPAIVIAFFANVILGAGVMNLVYGALVVGGFFALQFVVSRGAWIGGGDIRMGVLLGVMFGLVGGIEALFLAYILGAGVAVVMLLSGVATRKTMMPFGTFLALAGVVVMIWGQSLLNVLL